MTLTGIEPATFRFVAQHLNHCDTAVPGKAISITYSECVSLDLVIQHAKRMRVIVICGVSGSTKFFPHHHIKDATFLGGGGGELGA